METTRRTFGLRALLIVLLPALVASLLITCAFSTEAHAKTYGTAHVSKSVGKAYAKFLKQKHVGNFTVKNIGGKVPVLLVNAERFYFGNYDEYFHDLGGKIYIYKAGKVRKVGNLETTGSNPYRYGKKALVYWHNHWAMFLTVQHGKLVKRSYDLYYGNGEQYKGFDNSKNTRYKLNGKLKATGKRAIDSFLADKARFGYAKAKTISFKNNAEQNRKTILGFK